MDMDGFAIFCAILVGVGAVLAAMTLWMWR